LSEGFGRFSYKENKHFCYYSRGSLFETRCWLTKAFNRKLITEDEYFRFNKEIDVLGVKLNNYIKSIGNSTNDHLMTAKRNDYLMTINDGEA
jgi:four helix bundle protein